MSRALRAGTRAGRKLLRGTDAALALTEDLTESDTVVFLLSGGGSALLKAAASACGIAGRYESASCRGRGHRGDQHDPQAAFRRQGRTLRPALRAGAGLRCRAERYSGRPARHDRLGPHVSRQLKLCAGARYCEKVRPAPVGAGVGASGAGDAENAYKCRNADHRQRARSSARRPPRRAKRSATSR